MQDGSEGLADDVLDFLAEATKGLDGVGEYIPPAQDGSLSVPDRLRATWRQAAKEAEEMVRDKSPGHNGYLFTHGQLHVFVYLLSEGEVTAMLPIPYEIVDDVCKNAKAVAYQGLLHGRVVDPQDENENNEGEPA